MRTCPFHQPAVLVIPQVALMLPHACVQGLIFEVHFDLLQIILCMHLPCSADCFVLVQMKPIVLLAYSKQLE